MPQVFCSPPGSIPVPPTYSLAVDLEGAISELADVAETLNTRLAAIRKPNPLSGSAQGVNQTPPWSPMHLKVSRIREITSGFRELLDEIEL
jgi:hypothetical protein